MYTIFLNGMELGTFNSSVGGAQILARAVAVEFPAQHVQLRVATGHVSLVSTERAGKLAELINNGWNAQQPSVVAMAEFAGVMAPVRSHHGLLCM